VLQKQAVIVVHIGTRFQQVGAWRRGEGD